MTNIAIETVAHANMKNSEAIMKLGDAVTSLCDTIEKMQGRIEELENKPDIAFLRTMRERMDALEYQVKSVHYTNGGPWA
jgi:TolA-binding protein